MQDFKNFWLVCHKGMPTSKRVFWKVMQVLLSVAGIAALVSAPWSLSLIDNTYWRIVAWILVLILAIGLAICVGLLPYWGQKEMTRSVEEERKQMEECRWEEAAKVDILEQKIAKYKQKFGDIE
jgi:hypothetical protein